MTKTDCPAKCGKRFVSAEHALNHANQKHKGWDDPKNVKRKGWATPYGFGDWKEPITYDEACEQMKNLSEKFQWPKSNEIEEGKS